MYAVKCNPDPDLLRWIAFGRGGFDCASLKEVLLVKEVDAKNKEIVYANPCKKQQEIPVIESHDVTQTVIDSFEEIDKLQDAGWKGTSFLRIRVEDSGSLMPFRAKFGASIEDAFSLAKYARKKDQKLCGVSFHVGSGCMNAEQYDKAIDQSYHVLQELRRGGHTSANTIDIGGGFVKDTFQSISTSIDCTTRSYPSVRYIAEPGRFFAESFQDLFVQVIGKKPTLHGNGYRYTIDESLYGQFSCIPYDYATPKWIRVRSPGESKRKSCRAVLYGRTCDSLDLIAVAEKAEELCVGDWLWFPYMGAYTSVTSTEFNGFPKPQKLILYGDDSNQLPLTPFHESGWPQGISYVSPVKAPVF